MKYSTLGALSLVVMPLCFANTINTAPVPPKGHPVGSCYGGGIVFYVNKEPNAPEGHRGLIVALDDAYSGQTNWDNSGKTPVDTSSSYFSGEANTKTILNTVNDSPNPGDKDWSAAKLASEYITLETCPTCSDWYLPSQAELATVYFQSTNFKDFWSNCKGTPLQPNAYWSSTQYVNPYDPKDRRSAWYVDFRDGRVLQFLSMAGIGYVRDVRAF